MTVYNVSCVRSTASTPSMLYKIAGINVGPRLTHWNNLVLPLRRGFGSINSVSSIAERTEGNI